MPTYDSVDDAIGQTDGAMNRADPRESHTRRHRSAHVYVDDSSGPKRMPSSTGPESITTDYAPSPIFGSSSRPVLILLIVLSAAAGLTFWIVFGGRSATVIQPAESAGMQITPSVGVEFPNERPIWAPTATASVDPVYEIAPSGHTDGQGYPRTENPDAWYLPRIATATEPISVPPAATKQIPPVVSFQGKVETPDFRARHDDKQSSVY